MVIKSVWLYTFKPGSVKLIRVQGYRNVWEEKLLLFSYCIVNVSWLSIYCCFKFKLCRRTHVDCKQRYYVFNCFSFSDVCVSCHISVYRLYRCCVCVTVWCWDFYFVYGLHFPALILFLWLIITHALTYLSLLALCYILCAVFVVCFLWGGGGGAYHDYVPWCPKLHSHKSSVMARM